MAHGIADNFLVTAYLSAKCPVFIAPAMDLDMYNHQTTARNIDLLTSFGNIIIEPQVGELASGLSGPGRMEEPDSIFRLISDFFQRKNDMAGKKVVITAGPTFENIDPVRFIGNHSSGLMGFALATEAAFRGAEVTLISGPTNLTTGSPSINRIDIVSASEMHKACLEYFPTSDLMIMAAAVADYTIKHPLSNKIKKSEKTYSLELDPTVDILKELGAKKKPGQTLVGFALETENELANARQKLKQKNLDMVVLNNPYNEGSGFRQLTNKVTIIHKSGKVIDGVLKDKKEVAKDIIDAILSEYITRTTS